MNILITSDLHFSSLDRDEYKWDLFPWLSQQIDKFKVECLLLLGDSTEQKDSHKATLVNRIAFELNELARKTQIYILRGNHDGFTPETPFFKFLDLIPGIKFIIEPTEVTLGDKNFLFLPNTNNYKEDWVNWIPKFDEYDFILMHQTIQGAVAENGMVMEHGIEKDFFNTKAQIISGDIHKPQQIGNLTYCGSPHHNRFGDIYSPRVLLLKNGKVLSIPRKTIRKLTVNISSLDELKQIELQKGDQLKVRLALNDLVNWKQQRQEVVDYCKANSIELFEVEPVKQDAAAIIEKQKTKFRTVSPEVLFDQYCEANNVGPDTREYGIAILKGIIND